MVAITVSSLLKAAALALAVAAVLPGDVRQTLETMSKGGRDATFWLQQAVCLVGLAGVTWGVTALWDRFMEVRAQKGVDKLFDAIDYVLRPCVRLGRRGCSFVWRRLPPSTSRARTSCRKWLR